MMGGGFGGCVIHLLKAEAYDGYIATVKEKFAAEFGVEPRVIDVVIGDGARRIE
jgi:galactokinase